MRRNKISILGSIAGMLFLVGVAAPVTFTSCDTAASMPEINLTMESDYSGIIEAIKNGNKSLTDQLALIETAIKNGFKGNDEAIKLIEAAVKALQGTVEDKLAAIETAIESQTTSLETKLGLIEAAVKTGAADAQEQQELIAKAIKALQGSLEEKLAKIEEAVKGQTTSLETKLGLIETAVKEGLAGSEEEQKLIQEAIEALEGTVEDKLAKLEEAIKGQTTSLGTKLAAIEAAVKSGAADAAEQQELIKEAIEALGDALGDAMSSIKSAIGSQTTGLSTKLAAIETALKNGFVNEKNALDLIKTAVASISTTVGGMGTAMGVAVQNIIDAINGISSASSNEEIVKALNDIFDAIEGLTDFETIIPAIYNAIIKLIEGDTINGYAYVEMGDGLKWATMNVGATSPEEYGDYFAWGETTASKTNYDWDTYFDTSDGGVTFLKYANDKKTKLDPEDDAASQIWKGTWRIPTYTEWAALRDEVNFEWAWTDDYNETGIPGMVVTSKVAGYEGNSIFLPATGAQAGTSGEHAQQEGTQGYYWSSVLYEGDSDMASDLRFMDNHVSSYRMHRSYGLSIRAVSE